MIPNRQFAIDSHQIDSNRRMPFRSRPVQVLFERSPDPVCRFDRNLRFTYVNLAAASACNRPVSDFAGKTLRELGFSEQLTAQVEKGLIKGFEDSKAMTIDVDFDGPYGLKRYRCRLVPEHQDGFVTAVMVFSKEIT
jgi:PAS domain-containing protein